MKSVQLQGGIDHSLPPTVFIVPMTLDHENTQKKVVNGSLQLICTTSHYQENDTWQLWMFYDIRSPAFSESRLSSGIVSEPEHGHIAIYG